MNVLAACLSGAHGGQIRMPDALNSSHRWLRVTMWLLQTEPSSSDEQSVLWKAVFPVPVCMFLFASLSQQNSAGFTQRLRNYLHLTSENLHRILMFLK